MKKLINAVDAVVREQLMGMAAAHPELKVRIEPHYITRADSPVMGKVALVSGGGSGHEPMHGGLVGKGCWMVPAPARSLPRRPRIRCMSAARRSTAVPACCFW